MQIDQVSAGAAEGAGGQAAGTATGMYYDNARFYDPVNGRFLNQDPLGYWAGDPNVYRFVDNNPTGATDPSGMDPNLGGGDVLQGQNSGPQPNSSGPTIDYTQPLKDANGQPYEFADASSLQAGGAGAYQLVLGNDGSLTSSNVGQGLTVAEAAKLQFDQNEQAWRGLATSTSAGLQAVSPADQQSAGAFVLHNNVPQVEYYDRPIETWVDPESPEGVWQGFSDWFKNDPVGQGVATAAPLVLGAVAPEVEAADLVIDAAGATVDGLAESAVA